MSTDGTKFPDLTTLESVLASLLRRNGFGGGNVSILSRDPNAYVSTYPSEILKCRFSEEGEHTLVVKYQFAGWDIYSYGHRRGVEYEAAVYRDVLQPVQVSAPKFYGVYRDHTTGGTWLFIEFVEAASRIKSMENSDDLALCAEWLGRFHSRYEAADTTARLNFLISYDAEYYRGWAQRAMHFAETLGEPIDRVASMATAYEECINSLLKSAPTVIHGEFYPKNILFKGQKIYPVDWESAAIAVGEIDLASLTEGWGSRVTKICEDAYRRSRWGDEIPSDSERRLAAARVYLQIRWLGENLEYATAGRWRFDLLYDLVDKFKAVAS